MNSMVAFLLFGVVAIASTSSIKSTSSGWGPPPPASIDLELAAELAAVGQGQASAGQTLTESASGDHVVPGHIDSESGVIAVVQQNGDIVQVADANVNDGSANTVNLVAVSNVADAADILNAEITGANSAEVANAGWTDASGWGALGAAASSSNTVISKKN